MKFLRQLISAVALSILASTAAAQATGTCATDTTNITTCNYAINDDGYAVVPIPFGFPYYGRVFTHSIFFDNGIVSFYDPVTEGMRLGGQNYLAQSLSNNIGSNFHYSIMPLWSDLRNYSGSYFTETDGHGFLRYNWENISQWGYPDRLNTFGLEIRPTGYIGINYQQINISGYPVTAGLVGDASLGEWQQHFYAPSSQPVNTGDITNWSVNETVATDCSNPLSNTACPGYAQAYFDQQCSISALHSPSCPGYEAAFLADQCSKNTLYSPSCPGYDQAYTQWQVSQCTTNILSFQGQCETITPTAWLDYQCGLDPLYDDRCDGYADALYVKNCTADPLFDSGCTGYAEAYTLKYIVNADTTTPIDSTTTNSVVEEQTVVETKVEEKATVAATETREAAVSASPAVQATAPVSLAAAPAASPATALRTEARTEAPRTAAPARAAPTTRQALAEQRLAAAREKAAEAARENPGETAEAMDTADSMEQQVEIQNVVLGAMSFVPGFDAYGRATVPDAAFYPPLVIYPGQQNIDTPAARGLLGRSDRLHQEMVDGQYK